MKKWVKNTLPCFCTLKIKLINYCWEYRALRIRWIVIIIYYIWKVAQWQEVTRWLGFHSTYLAPPLSALQPDAGLFNLLCSRRGCSPLHPLVLLHLVVLPPAAVPAAEPAGCGAVAQGHAQRPLQGLQAACAHVGADIQAWLALLELLQLTVGLRKTWSREISFIKRDQAGKKMV